MSSLTFDERADHFIQFHLATESLITLCDLMMEVERYARGIPLKSMWEDPTIAQLYDITNSIGRAGSYPDMCAEEFEYHWNRSFPVVSNDGFISDIRNMYKEELMATSNNRITVKRIDGGFNENTREGKVLVRNLNGGEYITVERRKKRRDPRITIINVVEARKPSMAQPTRRWHLEIHEGDIKNTGDSSLAAAYGAVIDEYFGNEI